ncbi:MAG: hypothetical protein N3D11_05920 [Candidatus Sumerlaeia bacterium]|nr:hypothetical protein [Candidatus Sumerlaeia bacterium]
MREDKWPDGCESRFHRRRLPHLEIRGRSYFITYRLAGSLPQRVIAEMREQFGARFRLAAQIEDATKRQAEESIVREEMHAALDRHLDTGYGPCHLGDARIAALVAENLHHHAGHKYILNHWVIMPNHVHLILTPIEKTNGAGLWTLEEILHSLRSYTAHEAMRRISAAGRFWHREYYDRIIRDEADLAARASYIEANPVMPGLCKDPKEWCWSSAWGGSSWTAGGPPVL